MTTYQKISTLPSIVGPLKDEDMFIVSRPTVSEDGTTYDSNSTTYGKLSSDLYNKTENLIKEKYLDEYDKIEKVMNYSDVKSGGRRIVSENVVYGAKQKIDAIKTDEFLNKSTESKQSVVSPVEFNNGLVSLKDPSERNDVATKYYVDTHDTITKSCISKYGFAPLSSFTITSKESYEDISQGVIYSKKSNPIVFYNEEMRSLRIQFMVDGTGSSGTMGIFTYETTKGKSDYDDVRQELLSKFSDSSKDLTNLHIIDTITANTSDNITTVRMNVAADTYICLSRKLDIVKKKMDITYQGIDKSYNHSRENEHLTDPESYTDTSGYYYHYVKIIDSKGKEKFNKTYDLDQNGKKKLRYIPMTTQINTVQYKPTKTNFNESDLIQIDYVIE